MINRNVTVMMLSVATPGHTACGDEIMERSCFRSGLDCKQAGLLPEAYS